MPPTLDRTTQSRRRLEEVLRAIERYFRRHDRAPTVRDICHETGITSTSYVYYLLAGLELAGYITREPGARGIRLTRPRGVPIVGAIAAGQPLDLFDLGEYDTLDVAAHSRHADGADDEYAFRVRGDSMIEENIFDGDYILVRPGRTAPEGAIVVAVHLLHQVSPLGATTVKRYQIDRQRRCVLLYSVSAARPWCEIPMNEWKAEWAIQGTVTAVYRPYGVHGQSRLRPHAIRAGTS